MRELRKYAGPILKFVCVILAGIVMWQLVGVIKNWSPFHGVTVPELPALTASTNAPAGGKTGTNSATVAAGKGTNRPANSAGTNATIVKTENTNSVSPNAAVSGTNLFAATNLLSTTTTNANTNFTALSTPELIESNSVVPTNSAGSGNSNSIALPGAKTVSTNSALSPKAGTNAANSAVSTNAINGTNSLASTASGTNAASKKQNQKPPTAPAMAMGNPGGPGGLLELPPAVKARISKITDSEILGPVMHPLPQALLGIAGNVAFLRSASGQTGLVKEGDSLDDIKLLRVGINRVLIEQGGDKKELTIFNGYGSESLLQNNSTNENNHP